MIVSNKIINKLKQELNIDLEIINEKDLINIFCLGYEIGNDDGHHNYTNRGFYRDIRVKNSCKNNLCLNCKDPLYDLMEEKFKHCYSCQIEVLKEYYN